VLVVLVVVVGGTVVVVVVGGTVVVELEVVVVVGAVVVELVLGAVVVEPGAGAVVVVVGGGAVVVVVGCDVVVDEVVVVTPGNEVISSPFGPWHWLQRVGSTKVSWGSGLVMRLPVASDRWHWVHTSGPTVPCPPWQSTHVAAWAA
jgi:hypothetical protein